MIFGMNNTFAYIAGYIDGDGCFSIRKRFSERGYAFSCGSISACSVSNSSMDFFKEVCGGYVYASIPKNTRWKTQYHWAVEGKKAFNLCKSILPFLIEKRNGAEILFSFLSHPFNEKSSALIKRMMEVRAASNITKEDVLSLKKSDDNIETTQEEFAYLAGYIDAEGCIGISKYMPKDKPNYCYKIQLHIGSCDASVIKWIYNRFGGSVCFVSRTKKNPKWRNQVNWRISCKKCHEILLLLYPFLRLKKEVCGKAIEFYNTKLEGGDRISSSFKQRNADTLIIREELLRDIHLLNLKGSCVV